MFYIIDFIMLSDYVNTDIILRFPNGISDLTNEFNYFKNKAKSKKIICFSDMLNNATMAKNLNINEQFYVFNKHFDNFDGLYKLYIRINKFENYEQEELNNLLVFCIVFIHKGCIIYYLCGHKRNDINTLILNTRV